MVFAYIKYVILNFVLERKNTKNIIGFTNKTSNVDHQLYKSIVQISLDCMDNCAILQ